MFPYKRTCSIFYGLNKKAVAHVPVCEIFKRIKPAQELAVGLIPQNGYVNILVVRCGDEYGVLRIAPDEVPVVVVNHPVKVEEGLVLEETETVRMYSIVIQPVKCVKLVLERLLVRDDDDLAVLCRVSMAFFIPGRAGDLRNSSWLCSWKNHLDAVSPVNSITFGNDTSTSKSFTSSRVMFSPKFSLYRETIPSRSERSTSSQSMPNVIIPSNFSLVFISLSIIMRAHITLLVVRKCVIVTRFRTSETMFQFPVGVFRRVIFLFPPAWKIRSPIGFFPTLLHGSEFFWPCQCQPGLHPLQDLHE